MKHYRFGKRKAPKRRRKQPGEVAVPPTSPSSQGSSSEPSSPMSAPVTDGEVWEKKSNRKGFTYFVNRVTGDTVWEKPNETAVEGGNPEGGNSNVWDEWAKNGLEQSKQVWESYTDEVSGHEYYHNPITGENTWVMPGDATVVPGIREDTTGNSAAGGEARGRVGDWELCYDKDGTPYYYNFKTEESAWDVPSQKQGSRNRSKRNKRSTADGSFTSDSEYSDDSDSSYEDLEGGDVMEKLRKSAVELGSKASDIVNRVGPQAKDIGEKAWNFSKEQGSWVASASAAGVTSLWGWMSRVASRENLEWVQEGSISVVSSIQDWVDEVAVDPDAGVEQLVNSASKHGEETVGWMLGHEKEDTPFDANGEADDIENNINKENKEKQKYVQITFKPSDIESAKVGSDLGAESDTPVEPIGKVVQEVAKEHGNFQAKKLGNSIDEISARIKGMDPAVSLSK